MKANPKHSDANHSTGELAVGVGKVEAALPFFKTALEANPNIAQYWLSYIDVLIKLYTQGQIQLPYLIETTLALDLYYQNNFMLMLYKSVISEKLIALSVSCIIWIPTQVNIEYF